jgi:lysophospholipase L1-like esterase
MFMKRPVRCFAPALVGALLALTPLCLLSAAVRAQTPPAPAAPPKPEPQSYPERSPIWEKAIAGFEARDKAAGMPSPGGIVFVGSSSIVKWTTLTTDFPGLPVVNRGFGGSQIADSTYYAGRIVLPYKPRTVVFYAGDNDIAAHHTTAQVVGDFQTFAVKIREALPETKLLFLAIKPSPSRARFEPQMVAANAAIEQWIRGQRNVAFVDVHTPMLGSDGKPRPELYGPDKLHMTAEGYRLWTKVLAPYLP